MNYNKVAERLDNAARYGQATAQISTEEKFSLEEAYAIQSISIGRRYQRGEKYLGLKMGFTSKAKMEQMGVHDMIWGRLTDQMKYEHGSEIIKKQFIHPRAEPEIAFRLSKDITDKVSVSEVMDYVDSVAVAIEIIDSRYLNFQFSLEDVIADNCSSAAFSIGEWKTDVDITETPMSLVVNDKILHKGNSNAILGNPLESLVAAIRLAVDNGESLQAGHVILAGAATPAVYISEGQVVAAHASGLGSVSLRVK